MLIRLAEYMKPAQLLMKPHKGVVVENIDPKKLGRVKCTVEKIYEGSNEDLPWIFTKQDPTCLDVPKLGTELVIEFPFRCIYSAFYTGHWHNEANHDPYFDDNYPNTFGKKRTNVKWKFNDETKFGEFVHISELIATVSDLGDVLLDKAKTIQFKDVNINDILMNADGIKVKDKNNNEIIMDADGILVSDKNANTVTMNADGITVEDKNGNKIVLEAGKITIDAAGDCDIKASANVKIEATGKCDIVSAGPTKILAPNIILNAQLSGVTTANSHQNVVDFITGVPCIPSTTVFADV